MNKTTKELLLHTAILYFAWQITFIIIKLFIATEISWFAVFIPVYWAVFFALLWLVIKRRKKND